MSGTVRPSPILPPLLDETPPPVPSPLPPGWVISPIGPIDCSPEAQAARLAELRALFRKLHSGATSISDRGRSISYGTPSLLVSLGNNLRTEFNFCATGIWAPIRSTGRRIYTAPLFKEL